MLNLIQVTDIARIHQSEEQINHLHKTDSSQSLLLLLLPLNTHPQTLIQKAKDSKHLRVQNLQPRQTQINRENITKQKQPLRKESRGKESNSRLIYRSAEH